LFSPEMDYSVPPGAELDRDLVELNRLLAAKRPDAAPFTRAQLEGQDWAGGLVFAFWKSEVRGFLIDNARFFLSEYHVEGLRHDEVTVIDSHGGWNFCGDLTDTEHSCKNNAIEIAEYWRDDKTWTPSGMTGCVRASAAQFPKPPPGPVMNSTSMRLPARLIGA